MANKPDLAPDMAAEDVLRIRSQSPEVAVPKPHDDQKVVAVIIARRAEPHDFGLLINAGPRRLARKPKVAENDDRGRGQQEDQNLAILAKPKADDLNGGGRPPSFEILMSKACRYPERAAMTAMPFALRLASGNRGRL